MTCVYASFCVATIASAHCPARGVSVKADCRYWGNHENQNNVESAFG